MNKKFEIGLFGLNSNSGIAMTKSKKKDGRQIGKILKK